MKKQEYIEKINQKLQDNEKARTMLIKQVDLYYKALNEFELKEEKYNVGDRVHLQKGTLLHGTYKNIDGLRNIVKHGLISNWFVEGRKSKYQSCVCLWNLKKDYYLDEYINFYSGGTFGYYENKSTNICTTEVIPYDKLPLLPEYLKGKTYHMWLLEQTKESRFLPNLVQDSIQIGIIFNGNNEYITELMKNDILKFSDDDAKPFVNPAYYERFIVDRQNMNDFFTDRESIVLFGIPSCFIEGILVGKSYEKDENILNEIKKLLPKAYICNLEGKVIVK